MEGSVYLKPRQEYERYADPVLGKRNRQLVSARSIASLARMS
jgi:hypothetical protein